MRMPEKGSVRAAAWFAAALCALTLVVSLIPSMQASPAIQFFCFLPIVFFMIADQHEKAQKTIRELRERVEALETNARAKGPERQL